MDEVKPQILLFKGKGLISRLIRWQTRSKYSHAAILMRDGNIVESWQGVGVRVKKPTRWKDIDKFDVPDMTDDQWDAAIGFAKAQVGKGYDYWAIARFISRRHLPANNKWFCSELVFSAIKSVGVSLLERIYCDEVSPGVLSHSPMLKKSVD